MAAAPLEFYFDFSSPYAYLAVFKIDDLAGKHGRKVDWRPFLLGYIFQINGQKPLRDQELKWEYSVRDLERSARHQGLAWNLPDPFPVATQAAGRIFYWLKDQNNDLAVVYAKAVISHYFGKGLNIQPKEVAAEIAAELGVDGDAAMAAVDDQEYKVRLREESETAAGRNVCGSPFIFVDDEPFWGSDRLDMIDRWLKSGGW